MTAAMDERLVELRGVTVSYQVGESRIDALRAMAHAYRDYVARHPDRYLVQLSSPPTSQTRAAMDAAAQAVRDVLRGFGLGEAEVVRAHVAFRAAVHGFVHLEASGAMPSRDRDGDFEYFVDLFAAGLTHEGADD